MTPFTKRLCFIRLLDGLDGEGRTNLLNVEDDMELAALFKVALGNGYSDVAASIEVLAMRREETKEWEITT